MCIVGADWRPGTGAGRGSVGGRSAVCPGQAVQPRTQVFLLGQPRGMHVGAEQGGAGGHFGVGGRQRAAAVVEHRRAVGLAQLADGRSGVVG